MKQPSRHSERGFALLLVFLMAAAVAFELYRQLPRAAFESERDKEELLIERGEQYKRAIKVFVVANNRFPAKIEDLEDTNGKRYLRHRYIDPMTGKDEWRLIHVNAAGVLTDSAVQKPPAAGTGTNNNPLGGAQLSGGQPGTQLGAPLTGSQPSGPNATGAGQNGQPPEPQQVNAAVRQRPSDRTLTQNQVFSQPSSDPNYDPNNDPSKWGPITLLQANGQANGPNNGPNNGQPGQPIPGQPNQFQPGNPQFNPQGQLQAQQIPGQPFFGNTVGPSPDQQTLNQQTGQPNVPGQLQNGQLDPGQLQQGQLQQGQFQQGQLQNGTLPQGFPPGLPGQFPGPGQIPAAAAFNPQNLGITGQNQAVPVPNLPGQVVSTQTGGVQPTPFPGQPGNAGAASPTPGAAGGPNPALQMINDLLTKPNAAAAPNAAVSAGGIQGGIAGVASTYKAPSIKIYHDRQKFNEWEFIFDLKGNQPAANQTNTNQTSANGANPSGTNQQGANPQQSNQSNPFGFGSSTTFGPPATPPPAPSSAPSQP